MSRIQIYARIRPAYQRCEGFQASISSISLKTGYERDLLFSKSPAAKHEFRFDHVFDENSSQEDVFQKVALPVVDQFLLGYNGTVFAYGQTSSGKTYTMEGSARKYAERGIIPRVLSHMYKELEKRTGEEWSVHISYMEIYQDIGFDLLNPGSRPGSLMVTLPKVSVGEGPSGEVMMRNLSSHLAASEEVALSLLFQGSTCRKVAETSMNQCSSRSHSIFSITLTTRALGSEVITRSKMNLVDLAGSERVAKTGADGRVLQEAKHINLSLHHLEHVIVSLQHLARRGTPRLGSTPSCDHRPSPSRDRRPSPSHDHRLTTTSRGSERMLSGSSSSPSPEIKAGHIPYRNCLLTLVLKDSLGGNCLTAMIATVSAEDPNIWETVSTCRFSQRVAAVSNKARRNEELDDKALIKKLRSRVIELENQVLALKQENQAGLGSILPSKPLDDADRVACHQLLHRYLHGQAKDLVDEGINTLPLVQECFKVLRDIVVNSLGMGSSPTADQSHGASTGKGGASGSGLLPNAKKRKAVKVEGSVSTGNKTVVAMAKTPSPNSRQSSGFGSLQDEDGGLCESFSKEPAKPSEVYYTPPTLRAVPSDPMDIHSWAVPIKPSVMVSSQHPHTLTPQHPHTSPREQHVTSSVMSSRTKKGPLDSQEMQMSIYGQPHPPGVKTLEAEVQIMKEVPVPRPSLFDMEADGKVEGEGPQSSARSKPRHGRKHSREHQGLREHQELIGEVQLLALRVEEEELKGQLSQVAELLASQHAQVLQLESSDAVSSERLCSERLAEQQLRIKHARLHQRLLDAQHQMKMLSLVSDTSRKVGVAPWSDVGGAPPISSPPPESGSRHKVITEQSRHDLQQSKVQDQIEKLKVLQLEKQLELKEAATRRKLLAMKQQLSHGSAPGQGNSPMSPCTSNTKETFSPPGVHISSSTLSPPGVHITANALSPPGASNAPPTLGPSPLHSAVPLGPSPSLYKQTSDQMCPSPNSYSVDTPVRRVMSMSKTRAAPLEEHRTMATPLEEHRTKATLLEEHRTKATPLEEQRTKATLLEEHRTKATPTEEHRTKAIPTEEQRTKATPPGEHRTKATPTEEQRTKVSLPEEYKETAYMSAVDRQKVRVARVRRCIAAATIIQRWWRGTRR